MESRNIAGRPPLVAADGNQEPIALAVPGAEVAAAAAGVGKPCTENEITMLNGLPVRIRGRVRRM